jgi:endoglucanase
MNSRNLSLPWLTFFAFTCVLSIRADIQYAGVNLSGAEFGQNVLPGTFGSQYTYPTQQEVDYFRGRGMNIIRLPFRWERLQHTNNLALDAPELSRLNTFVSATTAKGVFVILDPHNFERYYPDPNDFQSSTQGLVGSAVPDSAFANFWGQVANVYRTNNHVIFGLMNEPDAMPTEQLLGSENAAIAAIRATGATNLILVPGNSYDGAWSWAMNFYGMPNAQVLTNIIDPGNNYAFEAHQYLDYDYSGTHTNIGNSVPVPDATVGATRLVAFTQWLRANNYRGFLGEFAVDNSMIGNGSSQIGDEALTNMLSYIQTNSDVWLGWSWWGGGPWWAANSLFHIDPASFTTPVDKPVMTVIKNFFPIPVPLLVSANAGQFQFAAQPGFVYQPQTSPDLMSGSWASYGSAVTGGGVTGIGQLVTVTMPVGSGSQGFYRVRVTHVP